MIKQQQTRYLMPAEWQRQSAIWASWPHNLETWPQNLAEAQDEFVKFVSLIAPTQPVMVLASGAALRHGQRRLAEVENATMIDIPTNDAWARDYAPTFVLDSDRRLVAIDWHYNAWGGKYPPYDDDQQVARRVAEFLEIESVSPPFCFEGGAVEINDEAVLLCTRTCALDPNRNPSMTIQQAEHMLRTYLGPEKIIWLTGDAIDGDDTDGHIDQLARFVDRETIVYAWSEDNRDPQSERLARNQADLRSQLDEAGLNHYRLIALPIPPPIEFCGRRIPASYCNFLITNELVLVPQFGVAADETAWQVLDSLFANRRVIGLDSRNLSVGLGSFHCLSQQQPDARSF